ncbi:MAG: aspartate carbamoyltransferase catalytic subunit [Xanthomonadaceae bacterium]|nr:aspartate carbamoyltransferase catalytic subunit [Xanthomonadaceae bacterium]MDP2184422.1 aspartate carbamoyltransferase catalytic subunit [Xanthomonadales bacterium]MDZ4115792.1 aspartate carbamoyltransferase catalytic subunit [Xanthomonadaceae bacterium]MDZ4379338.1 aspartate carbamoyltransferase catalytic subunit [Xanthomonadaceae bacterium]
MSYPWLRGDGRLRHLITLDGMPVALLNRLLNTAQAMCEHANGGLALRGRLAGTTLCTLFFEPSTRTRSSFQLAATRLGMDMLNFDIAVSSSGKGESDRDTLATLQAMGVNAFAVRHGRDGAVAELAEAAASGTVLINAGDGRNAHPSQGLLDMLTLRQAKGNDFSHLRVVICGDVRHSRVARSDIHALRTLGANEIRICGPQNLLPDDEVLAGCSVYSNFDEAIAGVDAVIMLRLQRERMSQGLVPSLDGYFREFGLSTERLRRAARDAIVLHPGPINRGIEIDPAVADGPQSRVLQQVANGVAVRMAVLAELLGR